ncbi:unnamed protein product [Rhizophagus irregularis]|nr:unnamed protein product [Rhizophagus irregularis]
MYKERMVYFVSCITNLNNKLSRFQEDDTNGFTGRILSPKKEKMFELNLPTFYNLFEFNSFVEQGEKNSNELHAREHIMRYKDILKFEGLGWLEYMLPKYIWKPKCRLSIEITGSIDMQIDYVRFTRINIG